MADIIKGPFHGPKNFGKFDLTTSQIGRLMVWDWDTAVLPAAKIRAYHGDKMVKEYLVGSGLTLSNSDKTITLRLEGVDFAEYCDKTISFSGNFFIEGNEEITFDLFIIKGKLS